MATAAQEAEAKAVKEVEASSFKVRVKTTMTFKGSRYKL